MADLVEVVFEGIEDSCIIKLFNSLIRSPDNVLTTQYPEDLKLFDNGSLIEGANSQLLSYSGDVSILVNIKLLNIGDLELPYAQLRLIKYGNCSKFVGRSTHQLGRFFPHLI